MVGGFASDPNGANVGTAVDVELTASGKYTIFLDFRHFQTNNNFKK